MKLADFLTSLWGDGRLTVPTWDSRKQTKSSTEVDDVILHAFEIDRETLADTPPDLHLPTARWSAEFFYGICILLTDRTVAGETLHDFFQLPCPEPLNPSTIYSVDLTMRYLPNLLPIAKSLNPADELIDYLQTLAGNWPLSSVGMKDITTKSVDIIMSNRCLSTLYVDRIIAAGDESRIADQRVRERLKQVVGAYPQLAGPLAKAFLSSSQE